MIAAAVWAEDVRAEDVRPGAWLGVTEPGRPFTLARVSRVADGATVGAWSVPWGVVELDGRRLDGRTERGTVPEGTYLVQYRTR